MALLSATIAADKAFAQFLPIQLRAVSCSGGQIGTTFDLSVSAGDRTTEVDALYFSHPGITAELQTIDPMPFSQTRQPKHGHFRVTIAPDVPPGRYEVRAKGRHGISNPRALLATPIPLQHSTTVSHDATSPTLIAPNTIVHSRVTAANVDYFGFEIKEDQSVRIELFAQQLDSRMIGQLKLYDSDRRVLASNRGADDVDPKIDTLELKAGQYVLALHDFMFRGGTEFHYQVVVRATSQPDMPSKSLLAYDSNVEGQLPESWNCRAFTLIGHKPLMASAATQASSGEPQSIHVPGDVTHWFPTQRRDCVFEFPADKDDTFAIDVVSQRLGEPTDARLRVERLEPQKSGEPKRHKVLTLDDSQSLGDGAVSLFAKDPSGLFKAPADANYRVTVRDLDDGEMLSLRQRFQLRIVPPDPGFDLLAYRMFPQRDAKQSTPHGSKMFRGGAETIRIMALRRDGWTGPIRITAENLPAGVTASDVVIGANQNQTQVTLLAAEDAAASVSPIRLIGHSENNAIAVPAVPATITWGKGGGRDFVRSRIASELFVAVSDKDLSPLSISIGDEKVTEVKKGEKLTLTVRLTRREGGKAECVLRPRDFPKAVSATELKIAAEKSEANWEIKTTNSTTAGTYSLWGQVETKIKVKLNPQALARAQQYRSHLQTLHDDPAQSANLDSIKAAVTEADKRIESAKAAAKEQELTVFIPTSNTTIRVVEP